MNKTQEREEIIKAFLEYDFVLTQNKLQIKQTFYIII